MVSVHAITNRGRRLDGRYGCFLLIFWLSWTAATAFATFQLGEQFHWFLFAWLIFGYFVVVFVPWWFWHSRQPQILTVTDDALEIAGSGNPFKKMKRLARSEPLLLHFGRFDEESVVTLNLFHGTGFREHDRIMLAPLLHWEEKYQILKEVEEFLSAHQFDLEVRDEMTVADVR